jgi:hypothetical protein
VKVDFEMRFCCIPTGNVHKGLADIESFDLTVPQFGKFDTKISRAGAVSRTLPRAGIFFTNCSAINLCLLISLESELCIPGSDCTFHGKTLIGFYCGSHLLCLLLGKE